MSSFQSIQERRRSGRNDYRDLKKHYVRINGWLPVFERHARLRDGAVRYLTLCSKEAIDVRYFALKGVLPRSAEKNEYPLLTFVEENPEDYAVIAETLGRVRLGIQARLEDVLLDEEHEEHGSLVGTFPHDIINLDFCGEVMPKKDHPYSETVKCIEKVVSLQAEKDPTCPWHLFLTFRTHRVQQNEEANTQLREILENNLAKEHFKPAYGQRPPPSQLLDGDYPEFLRLGICKYVAFCAERQGYRMTLDSSWVYGRQKGAYHIVKIVAGLVPLTRPNALPNPALINEAYDEAVEALFRSTATDVETGLGSDGVAEAVEKELRPVVNEIDELNIVAT